MSDRRTRESRLGSAIKARRKACRIKAKDMAADIGVTAVYYSLIENNRVIPSWGVLERIADCLRWDLWCVVLSARLLERRVPKKLKQAASMFGLENEQEA